jgi:hypothetical protein
MPRVVYCCSYSLCAFSLLVLNIVVASCWLSSGDVESSVFVTSTCAHHLRDLSTNCWIVVDIVELNT